MDPRQVDEIFKSLEGLLIELDPDPTVLGPNYIIERVATCRNHINKVSQIRQKLSMERRRLRILLAGEKSVYLVESSRLLASDEEVRKQPNIKDREAVINTRLRENCGRIASLEAELLDLDTVEQPVRMIHDELTRTAGEIRTQRSMINSDRTSGGGYGDESNNTVRPAPVKDCGLNEDDLALLMQSELVKAGEKFENPPKEPTPVVLSTVLTESPVTEEEIEGFLGVPTLTSNPEETTKVEKTPQEEVASIIDDFGDFGDILSKI